MKHFIKYYLLGVAIGLILLLLFSLFNCTNAQTVTLPAWVVDSLIFEAHSYRACDSLQFAQGKELTALGSELIANQNVVKMQTRQLQTADSLISGLKRETILVRESGEIKLKEEKKKSRRFKIAAAVEFGIIILILL